MKIETKINTERKRRLQYSVDTMEIDKVYVKFTHLQMDTLYIKKLVQGSKFNSVMLCITKDDIIPKQCSCFGDLDLFEEAPSDLTAVIKLTAGGKK